MALAIYGIGLPAFVLQKVLQPIYFAREDTKTPFKYALISMAINAIIAIGLEPRIGFMSAAIATSIAGWSMLILLWVGARKFKTAIRFDTVVYKKILIILCSSIIMGFCIFIAKNYFEFLFNHSMMKYLGLLIIISIGLLTYFFSKFVLAFLFLK